MLDDDESSPPRPLFSFPSTPWGRRALWLEAVSVALFCSALVVWWTAGGTNGFSVVAGCYASPLLAAFAGALSVLALLRREGAGAAVALLLAILAFTPGVLALSLL